MSTSATPDIIATIAAGLAGRLRSLVIMLDRLDRLESGSGAWRADFAVNELPEAATELTLRTLRTVGDPTNCAILKTMTTTQTHTIDALIKTTGLGRLALSERLNDLVQIGLATRLIDTNQAQITAAGIDAVALVETLAASAAGQYESANERRAK